MHLLLMVVMMSLGLGVVEVRVELLPREALNLRAECFDGSNLHSRISDDLARMRRLVDVSLTTERSFQRSWCGFVCKVLLEMVLLQCGVFF